MILLDRSESSTPEEISFQWWMKYYINIYICISLLECSPFWHGKPQSYFATNSPDVFLEWGVKNNLGSWNYRWKHRYLRSASLSWNCGQNTRVVYGKKMLWNIYDLQHGFVGQEHFMQYTLLCRSPIQILTRCDLRKSDNIIDKMVDKPWKRGWFFPSLAFEGGMSVIITHSSVALVQVKCAFHETVQSFEVALSLNERHISFTH